MGCQDKNFLLDGEKHLFPEVPSIVPYIVDLALSGRHKELWQFNPSTLYGLPRAIPTLAEAKTAKAVKTNAIAPFSVPSNRGLLLPVTFIVLFIIFLYFLLP